MSLYLDCQMYYIHCHYKKWWDIFWLEAYFTRNLWQYAKLNRIVIYCNILTKLPRSLLREECSLKNNYIYVFGENVLYIPTQNCVSPATDNFIYFWLSMDIIVRIDIHCDLLRPKTKKYQILIYSLVPGISVVWMRNCNSCIILSFKSIAI